MKCFICNTDDAVERHHILPKSKGGAHGSTIKCCSDCGGQIHMLFNNIELASMSVERLLGQEKIIKYIKWKKKHPGPHSHKASKEVKKWKKKHR